MDINKEHYLAVRKLYALINDVKSKESGFFSWTVFIKTFLFLKEICTRMFGQLTNFAKLIYSKRKKKKKMVKYLYGCKSVKHPFVNMPILRPY